MVLIGLMWRFVQAVVKGLRLDHATKRISIHDTQSIGPQEFNRGKPVSHKHRDNNAWPSLRRESAKKPTIEAGAVDARMPIDSTPNGEHEAENSPNGQRHIEETGTSGVSTRRVKMLRPVKGRMKDISRIARAIMAPFAVVNSCR